MCYFLRHKKLKELSTAIFDSSINISVVLWFQPTWVIPEIKGGTLAKYQQLRHLGARPGYICWLTIIKATFVLEAFKELKKQVNSLGLGEKSKSKFLMKEWRKMLETEAEEKRAEREAAAEERKLLAEREAAAEEKRAEREAEERKAALELEWLKLELKAKRLETAARPAGIAEEVVRRSARIARSPELLAFVNGGDDLDNYLLRFERYAAVAGLEKEAWATQLSPLLSGRSLEVYSSLS